MGKDCKCVSNIEERHICIIIYNIYIYIYPRSRVGAKAKSCVGLEFAQQVIYIIYYVNVILEFQRGVTYGWNMIVCVYHQSASIYLPTLKLLYKSYLVPMEFGNCILYGSYLAQILQGLHVTHRHVAVKKYIIISI